jgi:hypothetical protein
MVPHLTTALLGPLQDLERRFLDRMPDIERWIRTQWQEHAVPFYASVDLRNAGFKLAPVDTNLFPGGFNNLNPEFLPLCVQAIQAAVERVCPDARGVLLVPENHTRNTFYLQNVETLQNILRQAGMRVRIGSLNPEVTAATAVDLPSWGSLTLEPIVRTGRRVGLADFDPCMVLLNNDLSAGAPPYCGGHRPAGSRRSSPRAGTTARSRTRFRRLPPCGERVRDDARDRSLAHRSVLRRVRRDQFPGALGRGMPASNVSFLLDKIRGKCRVRHRREAIRDRQGRAPARTAWAS